MQKTGADMKLVADGMEYDKRIGRVFLDVGLGWGRSCFPKDIKAFIKMAEDYSVDFSLLKEVEKINANRVRNFLEKLKNTLWTLKDKRPAVWGLSFKPNTDEVREAPSLKIIPLLLHEGAKVVAYDPKAIKNFKLLFLEGEDLRYVEDMYETVKNGEALLILTDWEEFKKADLERVKSLLRLPIIVDGRNLYEPSKMREIVLLYREVIIGKPWNS